MLKKPLPNHRSGLSTSWKFYYLSPKLSFTCFHSFLVILMIMWAILNFHFTMFNLTNFVYFKRSVQVVVGHFASWETEDSDRWLWSWRTSFPFTNWETGKLWNENLVVSQIWLFRSFSLSLILFFHKRPQTEVGKLLCRQFWLKLVPTIRRPLIATY